MRPPPAITLVPIARDGGVRGVPQPLPELVTQIAEATAALYARVGFEPPWIGYLALQAGAPVGSCAFKSAPRDGRVEIAYFTFPPLEGRGLATQMAAELVRLAREHAGEVAIAAQTLPERTASHRVLEKLGFRHVATLEHPEDGLVWEWRAPSA